MKNISKKFIACLCALSAASLTACTSGPTVTFDKDKPWQDSGSAYEKLVYSVKIYNTVDGNTDETRYVIAEGELVYTLEEIAAAHAADNYTTLDMSFYVVFNSDAAEQDRGKRDEITSHTEFQTNGLATKTMQKTVSLADRQGVDNLSYTMSADYVNDRVAKHRFTKLADAVETTLQIPQGNYYDNEMMFDLARSTAISPNTATNFYMTNIPDCMARNKLTQYTMVASCLKDLAVINVGSWIDGYVVPEEKTEDEENKEEQEEETPLAPGELKCYNVVISTNETLKGPPYTVYYSERPLKIDGVTHKKVPVMISYPQYSGSTLTLLTEYKLISASFVKKA